MNQVCLIILSVFISSATLLGQNDREIRKYGLFSVALGKSVFSVKEEKLSFGKFNRWIPDIEMEMYRNKAVFAIAYKRYNSYYKIDEVGDVEFRKFNLFEIIYKKPLFRSEAAHLSVGTGLTLQSRREDIVGAIIMHGGWYEIRGIVEKSVSIGAVVGVNYRHDITNKLFMDASISYGAYIGECDIARIGINVGYYFGR